MSRLREVKVVITMIDAEGDEVAKVVRKGRFSTTDSRVDQPRKVAQIASEAGVAASRGAGLNV